jgi:hypothetical protein
VLVSLPSVRFALDGLLLIFKVMILRLRQLCCHPYLILSQTDKYDDPTALMGGEVEKERARAIKVKGRPWVEGVSVPLSFSVG